MDQDDSLPDGSTPPLEEAKALSESIVTIRMAQGKNIPSDFPHGSPEWQATALEFVKDNRPRSDGQGITSWRLILQ